MRRKRRQRKPQQEVCGLCPHAVTPAGTMQSVRDVWWDTCGCSGHTFSLAFETEQEDETKAPGEGKAGAEEGRFLAISVSHNAASLPRGFQCQILNSAAAERRQSAVNWAELPWPHP